jgi:hypothetical protein
MNENIFGRDTDDDKKYHDLYQSVLRIVTKSEKKDLDKEHSFKEITRYDTFIPSDVNASLNVQKTYKEIINKEILSGKK